MREIFASIMRFFGMYAPSQGARIAVYRKAGIRIGRVIEFGSRIWLDINYRNLINIEDDVILAEGTQILSHSLIYRDFEEGERGFYPVVIKKGARISVRVIILAGVTIGENSVIGAGAVVINDIPPNCVAVGVPAKPVRYFNSVAAMSDKHVVRNGKMPSNHPMLYVKCKTCGVEYWSAMRCNKQIFKTLDLRGNCLPCPNGHKHRYDKKDYYYKD